MSIMSDSNLLHPEYIDSMPFIGDFVAEKLERLARTESSHSSLGLPDISVVIRTLNEAGPLEELFEDIEAQKIGSDVQVIVVDNESTDGTPELAREFGATVRTIPRGEFTYPKSMNFGVEAADNKVVYLTVGHVLLSNKLLLSAAARSFLDGSTGAVYGTSLLSGKASTPERMLSIPFARSMSQRLVKKTGMGVMGATSAAIRKDVWQELGKFDERYESGGEDSAMAGRIIASGLDVMELPLLSAHHSHGLGWTDTAKQWLHWARTARGPIPLSRGVLAARRPDIDFS